MYVIVSRMHGMALDVSRAGTQPGTSVITYPRHGRDNQLWYDDPTTGTIRTKLNGFCLDVESDQKLRIMPYQQGDPNQQWERDPQGFIRNRVNRNKVLDIIRANQSPGAELCMYDANNGPNQLWNFEFVGGNAPQQPYPGQQQYPGQQYPQQYPGAGAAYPTGGSGAYPAQGGYQSYPSSAPVQSRRLFRIVSELNGKVLDVKGGVGNPGDDIVIWSKNAAVSKNQQWYSDPQGFIRSALNDYAIDGGTGKKIQVQPFTNSPNQQWVFEGKKIVNRANGECLDIWGEKEADGSTVGSYRWKDSRNQHWKQEYV